MKRFISVVCVIILVACAVLIAVRFSPDHGDEVAVNQPRSKASAGEPSAPNAGKDQSDATNGYSHGRATKTTLLRTNVPQPDMSDPRYVARFTNGVGQTSEISSKKPITKEQADSVQQFLDEQGKRNDPNGPFMKRYHELQELAKSLDVGMTKEKIIGLFREPTSQAGHYMLYSPDPTHTTRRITDAFSVLSLRLNDDGTLKSWGFQATPFTL